MCLNSTWRTFPACPACKANWGWTGNSRSGKQWITKTCKHLTSQPQFPLTNAPAEAVCLRVCSDFCRHWLDFAVWRRRRQYDALGCVSAIKLVTKNLQHNANIFKRTHSAISDLSSSFSCSLRKSLYLLYTVNSFLAILSRPMQVYTLYVMKLNRPRPT